MRGTSLAEPTAAGAGRPVRAIENVWIPVSDGTRLAARMWLPDDAETDPVPAILEYLPYRKRDARRAIDDAIHPQLAEHGYACARVDIRGYGDSEGRPADEYSAQELDDGVDIIAWLAAQPWCTGNVGMFGYSWGGANCMLLAARRPQPLKAIITHCASDDRYTDDAHHSGGCINNGLFSWGTAWTECGLPPPDPAIVGDRWRERWLERLDGLQFFVGDWVSHQHRDAFWQHGSVSEDYASITCAVYAVGGWADPYHHIVPRLLSRLSCPRKGLVGPWGHQYPHLGDPGPAIDWIAETVRWWDYWLKGIDTGIMAEPIYRVWMQDTPNLSRTHEMPGRWVAEETWPSQRITPTVRYLTAQGLTPEPAAETVHTLAPRQTVGVTEPQWLPRDMETELPGDQRIDDARSLVFDTEPLPDAVEILGAAKLTLDLAVDQPVAFLIARLNEIDTAGASHRLSYGILNLTHRDSHTTPQPLQPANRYRIHLTLHDCGQLMPAGHRLRIALSTTYWPLVWPAPHPVTLTLYAGNSTLELPVRAPRHGDRSLPPFGQPPQPPPHARLATQLEWDPRTRTLTRHTTSIANHTVEATGTTISASLNETLEISDDDPTSARASYRRTRQFRRGNWDARGEVTLRMQATEEDLLITADLAAFDHDRPIFTRTWNQKIQRKLV